MLPARVRTTVAIPPALLEAVDEAVEAGLAASRSELLATALRNELGRQRRAAIDRAFAEMATDPDYQREATEIADSFSAADWEALGQSEGRS